MDRNPDDIRERGPVVAPEWLVPDELPDGWVAEPIGMWDGQASMILYNPQRHTVVITRTGSISRALATTLPERDWDKVSEAPEGTVFVRDEVAHARASLDLNNVPRPDRSPGVEVPGL